MATRKPAWRKDRITSTVDEATGIRVVEWPRVKGMTAGTFEREHLGTTRAVIRMNKRAQGDEVPVPHRLTLVTIPADLAEFYA
jgi:hypothetical protein